MFLEKLVYVFTGIDFTKMFAHAIIVCGENISPLESLTKEGDNLYG